MRRTNPRTARTRAIVIAAARRLIAETGIESLTYTAVAKRSGITRQTLYRHWPDRAELLRDIMLEGPDNYPRLATNDVRTVLIDFVTGYARRMVLRENAEPVLELMRLADADPAACEHLAGLVDQRLVELNELLAPTGYSIEPIGFSLLLGPITSRRFVNRGPIPEEFVELIVDRFLGIPTPPVGIQVRGGARPAAKV